MIRKLDRTEKDYSTVFIFNLFISILFYGGLWFFAPTISDFYQRPELTNITRVLGLIIPVNATAIVQRIRFTVILDFKKIAIATFIAAVSSGTIAIILAYIYNQGVWALVIQSLTFAIVSTFVLNILNPWLPREPFCWMSFRELFGFGSKLLTAALIETIATNIYSIIIGRKYDASNLGQYTQANQLASVPAITITNILQRVTYPMLSNMQSDIERLDYTYLVIIKTSCCVVFPIMSLLAILSTPILTFLIGNEWLKASLLLTVLAIGYLLYPLHAINLNLLQVKGRSDLFLKIEIVKKIGMLLILIVTIKYDVLTVCVGIVVSSYFSLFINTYYTGKLSSISFKKQLLAIFPNWLLCLLFVFPTFYINNFLLNNSSLYLSILAILFIITYIIYVVTFQKDVFKVIMSFVKK